MRKMKFLILFLSFCIAHAQTPNTTQNIAQENAHAKNFLSNTPNQTQHSSISSSISPTHSTMIDSSQLDRYSYYTYRYNTRSDKPNDIHLIALGGIADNNALNGFYSGFLFDYDHLIDQYPLGFTFAYTFQSHNQSNRQSNQSNSQSRTNTTTNLHNAQLALYTDIFIGANQIQAEISQGFNFSENSALVTTLTNAYLKYGYVFALNSHGSFIQPLGRVNVYFLYNISKGGFNIPDLALNTNLDIGFQYKQFISQQFYFYVTPLLRQDIAVLDSDVLMRPIIDKNGSIDFTLPDNKYRTYGVLQAGFLCSLSTHTTLSLHFNGKLAYHMMHLGGNLTLDILF